MAADGAQENLWPSAWTPDVLSDMAQAESLLADHAWPRLEAALDAYRSALAQATRENEFLDTRLCDLLISACRDCLRGADALEHLQQQWTRMAIAYLVAADDRRHDFTDLEGLEDDAAVILGLLDALRRPDLAAPIRKHLQR